MPRHPCPALPFHFFLLTVRSAADEATQLRCREVYRAFLLARRTAGVVTFQVCSGRQGFTITRSKSRLQNPHHSNKQWYEETGLEGIESYEQLPRWREGRRSGNAAAHEGRPQCQPTARITLVAGCEMRHNTDSRPSGVGATSSQYAGGATQPAHPAAATPARHGSALCFPKHNTHANKTA
jgi:hypothetical protein